ncbi:SH3 domain-containing protein [Leptolyngbya sp. AN03gr2]|uniref:SH3 domain-containing protein n=1 Tax=unclassified Leptolyngbya TaxID=2650499 RepID=UPI003D31624C
METSATISVQSTLDRVVRSLKKFCLNLRSSAWIHIAGLMLGASILVAIVPAAQAFSVRVNSNVSAVNVRNGPGTQFGLNGRPLFPGEVVRVVNQSGNWYQLPDGGWFSSSFVTSGVGTGSGGVGGGGTPINRTVRATTTVNVRNGPGTGFSLNGRPLFPGETVRVIRQSGGWYQLSDGGWFSGQFAQVVSGGGVGGGGTPINRTVRVSTTVNVRNGPGTGFSLNGRPLFPGETVRVIRESGGWYQLPDGGWFSSGFASVVSGGGTGGGGSFASATVSTNGSNLVVRSSPSGGAIGSLANGTVVRLTGVRSGGFSQLSSGGWVSSTWLR